MSLTHSTAIRNALANAIAAAYASNGGNGRLAILSGAPVAAGSAQTGTVLATFTLPTTTVFGAASGGATALQAVSNVTAAATGTAGSFIFYITTETAITSAANSTDHRITGSVATSGGDMTIDSTSIVSGGTVQMSGWSWTSPA
jgi:hypothetical protein